MAEVTELWLEFEEVGPDFSDDPENDFFNMWARLDDGGIYALNVWTFTFFESARAGDRLTGGSLGGRYLVAPDLFVERLDRPTVELVIRDLAAREDLPADCLVTDPEFLANEAKDLGRAIGALRGDQLAEKGDAIFAGLSLDEFRARPEAERVEISKLHAAKRRASADPPR